ncbi:hypothetical protein HPB48_003769 [Haemaphysalis longicornis]|uniref:Uncharacterized protein n=1 Tax=Haemaphysalis longicornis TaxID=44386 RepID=A0A9J6F7D5_HAELO|nr:hypothetical protein HPB48_003769 [Haemaphysalis longicornis]
MQGWHIFFLSPTENILSFGRSFQTAVILLISLACTPSRLLVFASSSEEVLPSVHYRDRDDADNHRNAKRNTPEFVKDLYSLQSIPVPGVDYEFLPVPIKLPGEYGDAGSDNQESTVPDSAEKTSGDEPTTEKNDVPSGTRDGTDEQREETRYSVKGSVPRKAIFDNSEERYPSSPSDSVVASDRGEYESYPRRLPPPSNLRPRMQSQFPAASAYPGREDVEAPRPGFLGVSQARLEPQQTAHRDGDDRASKPALEFHFDIPNDKFHTDLANGRFSTFKEVPSSLDTLVSSDQANRFSHNGFQAYPSPNYRTPQPDEPRSDSYEDGGSYSRPDSGPRRYTSDRDYKAAASAMQIKTAPIESPRARRASKTSGHRQSKIAPDFIVKKPKPSLTTSSSNETMAPATCSERDSAQSFCLVDSSYPSKEIKRALLGDAEFERIFRELTRNDKSGSGASGVSRKLAGHCPSSKRSLREKSVQRPSAEILRSDSPGPKTGPVRRTLAEALQRRLPCSLRLHMRGHAVLTTPSLCVSWGRCCTTQHHRIPLYVWLSIDVGGYPSL